MEQGRANDRADCFYSAAYWYQSQPFTDFPALPPARERIPALKV
jgi:D-arabinan exo alpha-(1,3)/(1,5)-arabinofuranosidase (non-reducing end)